MKVALNSNSYSWEQRKLGDIFEFERPDKYMIKDDHYEETGIPVLTANKAFILGYKNETGAYSKGDCIIFDDFTLDSKYVDFPYKINSSVIKILTLKDNSNLKFDYYLLNQAKILQQGHARHYISVVQPTIVNVPKKCESNKIEKLFTNLDSLITLHQRKLIFLKLHRFRMSVLFCYSWEQRKLGDIGKTFTGLSGKTSNDFGHGEAKFLPYLNIFNNPIADVSFLESTEIDKSQNEIEYGDVFFTTSSETPDEVGMSSVWLGNGGNIYLNSFCFGFRPSIDFNPYYFGYLLRSDTFRNPVTILAQGISRFNISKNKVMEIEIPLPKKEEQEKIGQLFYRLDSLITLHQRKQL